MGYVLLFNALFLVISAIISLAYGEHSFYALLISAAISILFGLLPLILVKSVEEIRFQEGLAISVFGWITTCFAGMIPYLIWGGEFTFVNALFESISGYTTTGASILNDVERLPKGLLFWRSSTSFIGGVGIILFVLLILPQKKGALSSFYRIEMSDLSKMSFYTRSKHIIRIIGTVYCVLIVTQTILLSLLGMNFFDAICHAFTTVATSGFSTKNRSIAAFDNVWIEGIIALFMLISSMHFGLIYATLTGKKQNIFTSRPIQMYLLFVLTGIVLITSQLTYEKVYDFWNSLRYASFQMISLTSTTGYATADTSLWPIFSILILIYFSIQCGMVGSTTGGIKFDRIYLFFASANKQLKRILHPDSIHVVKIDQNVINHELELQVMVFIVLYIVTMMTTMLLLAAMGIDGTTAFSASVATIGNVGPGFGTVSSFGNYSPLPDAAKYILSVNMFLGRLEIMNVFALFLMIVRRK